MADHSDNPVLPLRGIRSRNRSSSFSINNPNLRGHKRENPGIITLEKLARLGRRLEHGHGGHHGSKLENTLLGQLGQTLDAIVGGSDVRLEGEIKQIGGTGASGREGLVGAGVKIMDENVTDLVADVFKTELVALGSVGEVVQLAGATEEVAGDGQVATAPESEVADGARVRTCSSQ